MSEEAADQETVHCTILQGPDGSLYSISDETLAAHRLPDDVAQAVRAAFEERSEVQGFEFAELPTFSILGTGPAVRRRGLTVPTYQTWFDM